MSRSIRRVRRNPESYIPSSAATNTNVETEGYLIRRIPRGTKNSTVTAANPTLAQRVTNLEGEIADINVALADQLTELNNQNKRLSSIEERVNAYLPPTPPQTDPCPPVPDGVGCPGYPPFYPYGAYAPGVAPYGPTLCRPLPYGVVPPCAPGVPPCNPPCGPGLPPVPYGGFAPVPSCNRCKPYRICRKHRSCCSNDQTSTSSDDSDSSSCESDSESSEKSSSSEKCKKKKDCCLKKNINSDANKCIRDALLSIQQNAYQEKHCCSQTSNECCVPEIKVNYQQENEEYHNIHLSIADDKSNNQSNNHCEAQINANCQDDCSGESSSESTEDNEYFVTYCPEEINYHHTHSFNIHEDGKTDNIHLPHDEIKISGYYGNDDVECKDKNLSECSCPHQSDHIEKGECSEKSDVCSDKSDGCKGEAEPNNMEPEKLHQSSDSIKLSPINPKYECTSDKLLSDNLDNDILFEEPKESNIKECQDKSNNTE